MTEYVRVVTFEADDAALEAVLNEINASGGPPEGVAATRITVLADRAAGKLVSPCASPRKRICRKAPRRSRR
jgi:hypothetical protein